MSSEHGGRDTHFEVRDLELTGAETLADAVRARAFVRLEGRVLDTINIPGVIAGTPRQRALRRTARRLFAELTIPPVAAQPALPSATVVVCTRARPDLLRSCLDALLAVDYPEVEIVVVGHASSPAAVEAAVREAGAVYVVEPEPGLDRARNRGLEAARGEIVAFTDDDARPEPGWLRGIARGFESSEVAAVTGLVLPEELDTHAQRLFENAYRGTRKGYDVRLVRSRGSRSPIRPERIGTGCNMAFRREELVRLGGFDPALDVGTPSGGGGDLDAFVRVLEAGGAIAYRPDAVVRHRHCRTMPELERRLYGDGSGYAAMLAAAFARGDRARRRLVVRTAVSWGFRRHLLRVVQRPLGREYLPMRLILAELRGALAGAGAYRDARTSAVGDPASGEGRR